jgi:uncharacterized protein YbjT (DUF2867 family)
LFIVVGVPHPSPSKAEQFRQIDLLAAREAIAAACSAPVQHFIYLSVAHPAPVMKAYIEVRTACEQMIRESGMNATILRPWYVLGPRHRWPYALLPVYWLLERIPGTRDGARRLGLISLAQMIRALVYAIEKPVHGIRVLGLPEMRNVPSALQESIAGAR